MSGSDDDDWNIVILTAAEHYVAHQLLVKMYPKHYGLVSAAHLMTGNAVNNFRNNKTYNWLREKSSKLKRGKKLSEKHKANVKKAIENRSEEDKKKQYEKSSKTQKGRQKTQVTRQKMSEAWKKLDKETKIKRIQKLTEARHKNPISEDTRKKMSESQKRRGPRTKEEKRKLSETLKDRKLPQWWIDKVAAANRGKKRSKETREQMSRDRKGVKQNIVTCPYCGISGGKGNMTRYHFDNCKENV